MEISPKMDEAFFWLCTCVFPLVVVVLLTGSMAEAPRVECCCGSRGFAACRYLRRAWTTERDRRAVRRSEEGKDLGVLLVSFVIPLLLVIPLSGFVISGVGISETPLAKAFCWSIEAIVLLAGAGMGALAVEENGNPWKGAKWGLWLAAIASFALVFLVNLVRIIGPGV